MDVYADVAKTIMCEAYKKGMTKDNGYVWFLPDHFSWDWYDPEEGVDPGCTFEEMTEGL